MKLHQVSAMLACAVGAFLPILSRAQTLAELPPVVVRTAPVSGAIDVPPGDVELRVTFSKDMQDQSWSFNPAIGGKESFVLVSKPRYEADHRTFVIKLKLQPNTLYAYQVNSSKLQNFRDTDGKSAVPYLLYFRTAAK